MNNGKKAIILISGLIFVTVVVVFYTFYKTVILDDYISFESEVETSEITE